MAAGFRHSVNRFSGVSSRLAWACLVAALLGLGAALRGDRSQALPQERATPDKPDAKAVAQEFEEQVRPFFTRHCRECHGIEKPKGDFHLNQLAPDFARAAGRERWLEVLKRVQGGEMPPKSKPRPPEKEVQALADWILARVQTTGGESREGRVVLRRLNRVEYENTVRDLLGVKVDLKDSLPEDTSAHGFDNVGEALHVSSFLMERYLEAADKALNVAIANGPRPPLIKKRFSIKDSHQVKTTTERVFRQLDDAVVCFSSSLWQGVTLTPFYPPDRGKYRFRISASGFQSSGKPVSFRVDVGPMLMATKNHLVGYFDAQAERPTVVEFVEHLEARSTIRILPYGLASAQAVHKVGADNYTGPGLAVQWIEVEGPLHDTWPPDSHRRLLGDLRQAPVMNNRNRIEVVSNDPEANAERIIRAFARRAFRRTVTDDDIKPFVALVKSRLAEKHTFEQAVRAGLMAVMVSPEFLFLREKVGAASRAAPGESSARLAGPTLDDFALASRLSYFLWSTMPDEVLLTLAEQRKLGQPDTLREQVERMLRDPRAAALTENFVDQWLGLRDIDFTEPSHILYPEFDQLLRVSMVQETHLFFEEVLKHDLSLTHSWPPTSRCSMAGWRGTTAFPAWKATRSARWRCRPAATGAAS